MLIAGIAGLLVFPDGRLMSNRWWAVVALGLVVVLSGEINDAARPGGR